MRTTPRHRLPFRPAVTLIECAGAAAILGLMITAGLRAAAGAGAAQAVSARALTGSLLAEGLLNEATSLAYAEPSGASTIGIDAGEVATNKATFDDVDDFHNWTESPPQSPGGSPIPNMTKWSRSVKVYRALLSAPESNSASETGLKRIEVSVTFSGKLVCKLTALRAADP
ncbi:MAG: hypothetical protein KF691_11340 [Phycisphaeraceae bacterium]|nr:hypothetical protein [Phycisphaeraceae bacterium]